MRPAECVGKGYNRVTNAGFTSVTRSVNDLSEETTRTTREQQRNKKQKEIKL